MLTEEEWDNLKDMLYQLMATTRDADIALGLVADGDGRAITLGEEVKMLRTVLHDLRLDSDAYRRGWRDACEACAVEIGKGKAVAFADGDAVIADCASACLAIQDGFTRAP